MLFHELFQANFSKFTWFSFPVIPWASYLKFVKFHGFYESNFWRIFVTWQHLCSIARSSSIPRSNSLLGRIDLSTANQQFGNLSVYNFSSSHVHFSKLWLIYCHFRKKKTNTLFRYNNMVLHTLVIDVNVVLESKAFVIVIHARNTIGIECPLTFNKLLFFNR